MHVNLYSSPIPTSPLPMVGLKTSPCFSFKTTTAFGQSTTSSVPASSSNNFSKNSPINKSSKIPSSSSTSLITENNEEKLSVCKQSNSNNDRRKVEKIKEQLRKEREKHGATMSPKISSREDAEMSEKARKIFPELPVSKCDGDKIEQHKDDYASTKRRLEEARARKMADEYKKKELER